MALSLSDPAREWLNKLMNKDAQYRDMASKMGYGRNDIPTVSGILDSDYAISGINVGGRLEFEKTTAIPSELQERLGSVRQCCRMGIFPQCRKAWLTVDAEFFLWNFEDGQDLAFYDGCQDVIISVSLLRPKLGVLPSAIEYLLALATPSNLIVLGVTYDYTTSQNNYYYNGVFNVLPTPLYTMFAGSNYITCMESTSNGRLFMGNREGDLLEFVYKPIPTLDDNMSAHTSCSDEFCSIVNHTASSLNYFLPTILTSGFRPSGAIVRISVDSRRGFLWTLSANSHLAVYRYDIPGSKTAANHLSKLSSLTASDLAYRAASVVRSVDRSHFSRIISIYALSEGAGPIQMMAVTASGIRIYFAEGLRIAHVRLPPLALLDPSIPDTSMMPQQQQQQHQQELPFQPFAFGDVKLVAETRGTVIFASTLPKSATDDLPPERINTLTLSVISPDPFPWSPCLSEIVTTSLKVESPWALTVLPSNDNSDTVGIPNALLAVSSSSFNKKGIELPHESSGFSQTDPQKAGYGGVTFCAQPQQHPQPSQPPFPKGSPPVMLTQHLDPNYRRVLVITAHGIVHLRLPSPLQRLREFLLTSGAVPFTTDATVSLDSADRNFLSTFLHQFGPEESICAAIAIAASEQGKTDVVAQAERAVVYFAAEAARFWQPPVLCHGAASATAPALGVVAAMGAMTSLPELGMMGSLGQQEAMADTFLVLGASLFLSRVARPLWRAPMLAVADQTALGFSSASHRPDSMSGGLTSFFYTFVSTAIAKATASASAVSKNSLIITSRLNSDDLEWVLHQLRYLKALLESSSQKASISSTSSFLNGRRSGPTESTLSPLARLTQDLCLLLSSFIEFTGLWQIISQHNVHAITSQLSEEQRTDLISLPVEAFVCWMPRTAAASSPITSTIPDIRSALITALIEYYISGQCLTASVEALCARLRSVCPNLFGNEDALCARAEELLMRAASLTTSGEHRDELIAEAVDLLHSAGPSLNIAAAVNKLVTTVGGWGAAISLCLSIARQRDPLDVTLACLRESRQPAAEASASLLLGKSASATPRTEVEVVESRYDAYRVALGCLSSLLEMACLPTSASLIPESELETQSEPLGGVLQSIGVNPTKEVVRRTLLAILKFIFKSDDMVAHFEVIAWLLSNGLLEQVVELNSPYLEVYLQSHLCQTPNDVALRRLLWRQLEARGARREAAQVLEHLATTAGAGEGLTLEDRLDYLARAIVAIKALPQSQLVETSEYLADLQDRLEVAELQRQLCIELAGTSTSAAVSTSTTFSRSEVEQALTELTRGPLLPASELFACYADPFELHESKLLLLHFAGEADVDLVEAIWTSLLHRLLLCGDGDSHLNSPVQTRRKRLSTNRKIARGLELTLSTCLSRLYMRLAVATVNLSLNATVSTTTVPLYAPHSADYTFFPLVVIISTLERYAIQQSLPFNWVPSIFASAKIPSGPEIVEAYNIILCRKNSFWMQDCVRSRLMEAIYTFITDFIENANRLPLRRRQLQSSRMLDHLTTHLVELHAEPKTSSGDLGCGAQATRTQAAARSNSLGSQSSVMLSRLVYMPPVPKRRVLWIPFCNGYFYSNN
ncbi:nuclear pore complex protein nup155 [Echinococcus multilocularis]|uniref:Nuclear pore complex protein nup155 n=1 Tax=Echinococcus multilocularis TaxID=6211 RepID=A0A087VY19_ECHMU|nr:nuclear pore complex protein nup155 [Echinococcus multilocularis]